MKLSSIITGVPEYIEFAWVTAPNAAGQSITANTITTLTLTTEVADTANIVSAPSSNEFTLPAGTYYFEATTSARWSGGGRRGATLALYNVSDSEYVTRGRLQWSDSRHSAGINVDRLTGSTNGQMSISASKTFDLRFLCNVDATIDNGCADTALSTDSTANADQRTTIKLWKLK